MGNKCIFCFSAYRHTCLYTDISYFYALTVNFIFAIFYVGFGLTYSNYHYTYDKIYHEVIITDSDIKVDNGIDDLVNNLVYKRKKELFKKVEEYMSAKPYLDPMFSQTVMIKDLFIYERYLSNAIQNSCGMTVKKYIDRYRIENACKELVDSNDMKKIEDIALASGFTNDRTFFRLFKEAKGMTPLAYRKENLINKERCCRIRKFSRL